MKLSPAETQALTKKVNADLEPINAQKHTGMPLREITLVLTKHDLDPSKVQEHLHGDEGRLHVQVGPEMWLTMTWYRLGSGRYEIVAYASSAHDDHRDPYTTVMDSTSKRKATKKLNGLLEPVNKTRYTGKAQAFGVIQDAIASCGFDWHEFEDDTVAGKVNGNEGRKHIAIGNGIFVTVTWYKMDVTGKYEIVAYAS
jgi:hypothetical protein